MRLLTAPLPICYDTTKSAKERVTMAKSVLIADTTVQERIQIVRQWILEDEALDGCDIDLWEFYDDYIKGKKEISECNAAFAETLRF